MDVGPSLIFDKSTLEGLSLDESVWLDHFFRVSITPLFFIETLADLEKQVHSGRTPEQVVGHLARKTPDMNSYPAMHHRSLLDVELSGKDKITMDGRPVLHGGKAVQLDGSKGMIFAQTQEEEAFSRWQRGDFLGIERQIAKFWRQNVCEVDHAPTYSYFQRLFPGGTKPRDLVEAKNLADRYIDGQNQEASLQFGLTLLRYAADTRRFVVNRWRKEGSPKLREFAPYFCYLFCVELFFYLAVSADLISRVRPMGKADNKVDITYLYYLPFCNVFTSSDNLHARVVPLFLRSNQSFIEGQDLKSGLQEIDAHYAALPDEMKTRGLHAFASNPPEQTAFLVTRLWDLYLPRWRTSSRSVDLPEDLKKALVDLATRFTEASQPAKPDEVHTIADADFVHIQRLVSPQKGKWRRVPPGAD